MPISPFIEPELIGEGSHSLIKDLLKTYQLCVNDKRPIWVSLEGHSGCGKSRIVQEFYRSLSERQTTRYWPDNIYGVEVIDSVEGLRKTVFPKMDKTDKLTYPDYMWWGVRCGISGCTASETLANDLRQFQHHELPLETAYKYKLSTKKKLSRGIKAVLRDAYSGGKNDIRDTLEEEVSKEILGELAGDISGYNILRRPLAAMWKLQKKKEAAQSAYSHGMKIDNTISKEPIDAAIKAIVNLSTGGMIPVVMYIEDLHNASESLIQVIHGIMGRSDLAVLVVTTTWPGEIDTNTLIAPLKTLKQTSIRGQKYVHRVRTNTSDSADSLDNQLFSGEFTGLTIDDKRKIIEQYYPEVSAIRANAILERIDQPLLLVLVLNGLVQDNVESLDELSTDDISDLPASVHDHYDQSWARLPQAIRNSLLYGLLSVPHVANEGYQYEKLEWSLSLLRSALASVGIEIETVDSYASEPRVFHWVRNQDEQLSEYRDWVQFEQVLRHERKIRRKRPAILKAIAEQACEAYTESRVGFGNNEYLLQLIIALAEIYPPLIIDCDLLRDVYRKRMETLSEFPRELKETIRLANKVLKYSGNLIDTEALCIRAKIADWTAESGDIATAIQMYKKLIIDQERVSGKDGPETLDTRNDIAYWTGKSGDPKKALKLSEELLPDRNRVLGSNHVGTLTTRSNIAYFTGETGDSVTALSLFEVLLIDYERMLNIDHPETLRIRNNIAYWTSCNDVDGALQLYKYLLVDRERISGSDHPATLTVHNNIASCYGNRGDSARAYSLFKDMLPDHVRVLGVDHPDTLIVRDNIAYWCAKSGDVMTALTLLRDLLDDRTRVLGVDHIDTLSTRTGVASLIKKNGDIIEATRLAKELLHDQERVLGVAHPNAFNTRNNIANWIGESGNFGTALELFKELLRDRKHVQGLDHPETLTTRNNIAYWCAESGDIESSLGLYKDLLRDRERVLGQEHPDTIITNNGVQHCLSRIG